MPRKHLGSPEQPSFELPSLPPWRTPKIKILHHTPSKGRSLLDDRDIFETPRNLMEDSAATNKRVKNSEVYDFTPFCDKKLLAASKIGNMRSSESATHCLVFHKDKHKAETALKDFRPDLDLWCCDSSEDELEKPSSSLERNGITDDVQGSTDGGAGHHFSSTGHLLHPNSRPRFDTGVSAEKSTLRQFWNGSDAAETLERSQLHDIHSVLLHEQDLIHRHQRQIQQNEPVLPETEPDFYKWLRKYCQTVSDRDSWIWTPQLDITDGGTHRTDYYVTPSDYVSTNVTHST
ncbi:LAFA_0E04984g1_1 [Lachancea sp. 'fantastica']|nr:LAFA_0E04984g1_1 [Lachancea sp. 'fantastica']